MPRYFFLHIPRTGGGTLRKIISAHCTDSSWVGIYPGKNPSFLDMPGFLALPSPALQKIRFVIGFFPCAARHDSQFTGQHATLIRNPVSRVISQYRYHKIKGDLEAGFQLSDLTASRPLWACNLQTRLLCGATDEKLTEDHLTQAKTQLKEFCLVGTTERFNEFYLALADFAGWTPTPFAKSFATPPETQDPATHASLAELNNLDQELWSFADELLNTALTRYGRNFFKTRLSNFELQQDNFTKEYSTSRTQLLARQYDSRKDIDLLGFFDPVQQGKAVTGWAYSPKDPKPLTVTLLVNGIPQAEQQAVLMRYDLFQLGLHPTGLCGFRFQEAINALQRDEIITVVAQGDTPRELPPGPREVLPLLSRAS